MKRERLAYVGPPSVRDLVLAAVPDSSPRYFDAVVRDVVAAGPKFGDRELVPRWLAERSATAEIGLLATELVIEVYRDREGRFWIRRRSAAATIRPRGAP
jgi:hypothetical protein